MTLKTIQECLNDIDRPSRYLGSEINRVKKDPRDVNLHMALVFPDLYEIGTSHFGIQILYHILNQQKDIYAERAFCPDVDMEKLMRDNQIPATSMETHTPLNQFGLLGFSLLYELNYTNVLNILDLAGIPFYSAQRDHSHPVIIAGGPCAFNPEPVADLFDAIVIGDAEDVIKNMARSWITWDQSRDRNKRTLLKEWSRLDGVYVPSFFKPEYDPDGTQRLIPRFPEYQRIKKAVVRDLNEASFPEKPIIPYGKPIHDRLRLEIARGCSRGCRFCQAGMIYRPVRERSLGTVYDLAVDSLLNTGYEDLSLLSLSTGDYTCIQALMEKLMVQGEKDHTAVSLPSLRAGTLTPRLMKQIQKVRKTGFTIAPEAGSQRLRNVINKNITEKEIMDTVRNAFELGWKVIKLYFMIGLPTETEADIQEMIDLVKKIREIKYPKGRINKINVSITTFVPKSHTPFEREPQISLEKARGIIQFLRNELKLPGIQVKWQNPNVSQVEGLWARGDRKLTALLVRAFQKGCKLDGWTDHFKYDRWAEACHELGIDMDGHNGRVRPLSEPKPWDHVDALLEPGFLIEENKKSRGEIRTGDCKTEDCNQCGVCDFKTIQPMINHPKEQDLDRPHMEPGQTGEFNHYTLIFSKTGSARFFGHLEMVNIITRAMKRAEIPVRFSEGFHPKPKISFVDALPIGMESHHEYMFAFIGNDVGIEDIKNRINKNLPTGLCIKHCRPWRMEDKKAKFLEQRYRVISRDNLFDHDSIQRFQKEKTVIIHRKNKKGKVKEIDLKKRLVKMTWSSETELEMAIQPGPEMNIRPQEALKKIFDLKEKDLLSTGVVKL